MNKTLILSEFSWMCKNYPDIRLVGQIPFRCPKSDNGQTPLSNWESVRMTDMARYWLYIDLLPDAPLAKVKAWWLAYVSTDFAAYNEALEVVYELTRRDQLQAISVSQFKAAIRSFNVSCNLLLGPLWPRVERLLLSKESGEKPLDVKLVADVFQWTRLSARISLDNPDLDQACWESFAENQSRLDQLWSRPDTLRDKVLSMMRKILSRWYNDAEFRPQPGHHGSGAVAEQIAKRLASRKCKLLHYSDVRLAYYCKRFDLDVVQDLPYGCPTSRPPLVRHSRWLTVPKSIKKRRGIAPQPAILMWYQQGVLDALYQLVWSQPFVKEHFPIFDRSVNRGLALSGSLRDHWSTYDLSNASDSVTVHLVKSVFGPNLRTALICLRCTNTDAHELMVTYGTMGDATVFPVETLVIGAALQTALILAREHDESVLLNAFYVFGDDIVVQNNDTVHYYIHRVFDCLGFQINDDKSFIHGRYRESCGIEAYNGHSVEPMYFLNRSSYPTQRANRIVVLTSAANNAYEHCFRTLREWFLLLLSRECFGMANIAFTEDATDTSKVYTPFLTERGSYRWNTSLYRLERRFISVVSKADRSNCEPDMEEWYRYYLYLLNPPERTDPWQVKDYTRSFLNRNLHIRKVWVDVRLLEAGRPDVK